MKSYATNDKGGTRLPSELERRSKDKYPPMKGFSVKELSEALSNPKKGFETPKVSEAKSAALKNRKKGKLKKEIKKFNAEQPEDYRYKQK